MTRLAGHVARHIARKGLFGAVITERWIDQQNIVEREAHRRSVVIDIDTTKGNSRNIPFIEHLRGCH